MPNIKKTKPKKKEDEYAIRCFLNGKRKLTHQLTKKEADIFRNTAIHLLLFLTKEYKLSVKLDVVEKRKTK